MYSQWYFSLQPAIQILVQPEATVRAIKQVLSAQNLGPNSHDFASYQS